ncbi:MAG: hypothetical protein ACTH7Q_09230 [Pseudoalteromonas sp.]
MVNYIEQCKALSLTARVSIALKIFECFCNENSLKHPMIAEFQNYLWQWPLIDGADQFESWESDRPFLVNYGIGDDSTIELETLLSKADISEPRFHKIVASVVGILWGSFWGACEDEQSLDSLATVVELSKIEYLPNLTPLKFSLFSDNNGWGYKLNAEDVTYWRNYRNFV